MSKESWLKDPASTSARWTRGDTSSTTRTHGDSWGFYGTSNRSFVKEMPDLVVIDIDVPPQDRMELYQKFWTVRVIPILARLPN